MKTFLPTILCFSLTAFTSCNGPKKITKVNKTTEIEVPLSGKEYQSNKDYFRAKQLGESPDLATAKKIAMQNAKAEMASNIQALVKRVTDQYTNQRTVGEKKEFENKFEELAREVVNQTLTDVKIIGEKLFKDGNRYQYWVALESSKETVLNSIGEKISEDEKLNLDFDKFQYQKLFNEEMEKFEEESNDN